MIAVVVLYRQRLCPDTGRVNVLGDGFAEAGGPTKVALVEPSREPGHASVAERGCGIAVHDI